MSATCSQEIAGAAASSGASTGIAGIAAFGSHTSNAERDLLRLGSRRFGQQVALFHVETVIRDPCHLAAVCSTLPMLRPHEFAANMFKNHRSRFHELFGTSHLKEFWAHVEAARENWWLEHPARPEIIRSGGEFHIPFSLFGDEGGWVKLGM